MQPIDAEVGPTENFSFSPPVDSPDPGLGSLGTDAGVSDESALGSLGGGGSLQGAPGEEIITEMTPPEPGSTTSQPLETLIEESPTAGNEAGPASEEGDPSDLIGEDSKPAAEDE